MIFASWNVNGMRAVLRKGFGSWLSSSGADVVALQEIKALPEQIPEEERGFDGYESVWNPARVKKGYSGVACYFRSSPLSIDFGLHDERFRGEGRCLLMEYDDFHFLNVYFPNGQMSQERLDFKLAYYDAFLDYAQKLRKSKPLVICGDFNTAHRPIDLKNPKRNEDRSGFLPVERAWLDRFVAAGYVDTFRLFNQAPGQYTWWSYRFGARTRNAGWRIDYFFVSSELREKVKRAWIEPEVQGSDHCPVGLELDS